MSDYQHIRIDYDRWRFHGRLIARVSSTAKSMASSWDRPALSRAFSNRDPVQRHPAAVGDRFHHSFRADRYYPRADAHRHAQDVFWIGLAITIMFGVTFGTILTMLVVPTLYATLYRLKKEDISGPQQVSGLSSQPG